MDKKHIGSSLSDFLKDTGRLGQARRVAIKRVLAWQVSRIGKYFIAWASRRKRSTGHE